MILAETKPSLLLNGDKPRLLDEWQLAPVLWDAVRVAVDCSSEICLYILLRHDRQRIRRRKTGIRKSRFEIISTINRIRNYAIYLDFSISRYILLI